MKNVVRSLIVLIVVLFLFAGCQSSQMDLGSKFDEHACTACDKGKAGEAIWCDTCNAGYVNGKKITCKGCFDSKTKGTVCKICQKK